MAALDQTAGGHLHLGEVAAIVGPFNEQVNWTRKPSRGRHDVVTLPWPTTDYELHPVEARHDRPSDFLIGENCPSFPSYETAFRAFFYDEFSVFGGQMPLERALIRLIQSEAWLQRVRVTPTQIDLQIAGEPEGTRVEVNGAQSRMAKRVGRTGRVRLALPVGLPDDAWLYLSRGTRWLDYRVLGHRLISTEDPIRSGVEIEIPDDPESRIDALLSAGEGPSIEYKLKLPDESESSKRKVLKTVVPSPMPMAGAWSSVWIPMKSRSLDLMTVMF